MGNPFSYPPPLCRLNLRNVQSSWTVCLNKRTTYTLFCYCSLGVGGWMNSWRSTNPTISMFFCPSTGSLTDWLTVCSFGKPNSQESIKAFSDFSYLILIEFSITRLRRRYKHIWYDTMSKGRNHWLSTTIDISTDRGAVKRIPSYQSRIVTGGGKYICSKYHHAIHEKICLPFIIQSEGESERD